ncbi:MAG: PAS domain-containing protein, partial [Anaerolineales bacterium]|nr:PAS domain-containing protein [Anaerolineales bacterium]
RFIFVNQTVADFFAQPIHTLRGQSADIYLASEQDRQRIAQEDAQILEDGIPTFSPNTKLVNQHTQKTHIFEVTKIPIRIPGTDTPAILGIGTDITNWRETEENMRHALQKEQELGQLKLQFISLTSHQFRTPLATIQSIVDGLLHFGDRMTADQRLDRLNKIQAQVHEMTKILNEIHVLGRAQSNRLESHLRPYDMVALCADIIAYTRKELNAPLTIVSQLPDEPLTAVVDADLVHHIVYNLLSNAVKYSPPESTVTVQLAHGRVPDTDQPAAILTIQDQGIGIPTDEQDKIFDSFFRGSNVQQRHGTGLGLAIVQEAITKLNGQIHLQSQPNRGSTFTVVFPKAPTE